MFWNKNKPQQSPSPSNERSDRAPQVEQKITPGYYLGFQTLDQQNYWDAATRKVVLDRVANIPSVRFFTPDEAYIMQAVVDRILPQEDRTDATRIPILPFLDERLHLNRIEGYRYEDMPSDQEAYRVACRAIDATAKELHNKPFYSLSTLMQEAILQSLHDTNPMAAQDTISALREGKTRLRSALTTAARVSAAVPFIGPPSCRAFTHPTSRSIRRMVSVPTGRSATKRSSPTINSLNARCLSPDLLTTPGANLTAIPNGPHPVGQVGNVLIKGCTVLGIPVSAGGPVAILSASHGDRPHCIYRGFCIQGCKVGAKASTLVTHVPDAIASGAEIRDNSMVARVSIDNKGRTDGIVYFDAEGKEHFQRARAVIVCGYALETPRLLFNSACPGHEQGLANSSGTLGKYLMAQAGNVILGKFDDLIRQYKAPPAHALTEEFYETDPKRDFARGFAVQTVGPLPIAFSKQLMAAKGLWGWGLRREMMDYNHWSPLGLLGEILPWEDNRIEVADGSSGRHDARDRFGLPVAQVTFTLRDNDKKLIEFGKNKVMDIMRAAGAKEVIQEQRYAHLVGGARMSATATTGVCDKFGRTWDIPNLFIMDGSVFPTQGSANPGLTIQALAARTADYLITQNDAIFQSSKRDLAEPGCRLTLSPPGTFSKGVPHL